jgi:hypothetical protein
MSDYVNLFAVAVPEFLAKEERYMHMGRRFRRSGSNIDTGHLLAMLAIIAIVAAIAG